MPPLAARRNQGGYECSYGREELMQRRFTMAVTISLKVAVFDRSTGSPGEFAAGTACNIRVEACSGQCSRAYEASGAAGRYLEYEDRRRASKGPSCP